MIRRLVPALGFLLSGALVASAQSAGVAQTRVGLRISLQQFRTLRWLEGTWRAQMPNGQYFYERYVRANDSTIRVLHFPDSTLVKSTEEDTISLRNGVLRHGRAEAIRFRTTSVDFAAPPRSTPQFTFTRATGGEWTATIHGAGKDGKPIIYRMKRFIAAKPRSEEDQPHVP